MFKNKDWNGRADGQLGLLCEVCGARFGQHFGQECPEVKNEPLKPVHRIRASFCPDCKREKLPTFDEWFKANHGLYFDDCHMLTHGHIAEDMKKLTRYMREYVSEMVRTE